METGERQLGQHQLDSSPGGEVQRHPTGIQGKDSKYSRTPIFYSISKPKSLQDIRVLLEVFFLIQV